MRTKHIHNRNHTLLAAALVSVSVSILLSSISSSVDAFTTPAPLAPLSSSNKLAFANSNINPNLTILNTSASASASASTSASARRSKFTQLFSSYVPPEISEARSKRLPPYPKVGDLVRYFDLDGGRQDGQELVGKITFIQRGTTGSTKSRSTGADESSGWLAEVTELDNVGDGYYAEYPSRKRRKSKLYDLIDVSPLIGSFVRTEDAFKVPLDRSGRVSPAFETYYLQDYEGPQAAPVNEEVLLSDLQKYGELKGKLIRDAVIAGLIGTIVANIVGGLGDAFVYFVGAIAGVGYLFFLSVKTDTLGSTDAKLGSNIANVRFALPLIVLLGIALQNLSLGSSSPVADDGNIFNTVSKDQFASAMLGFLTYRIPLFLSQLGPIIGDSTGLLLPGSAGIAMQMASEAKNNKTGSGSSRSLFEDGDLTTVLVISGPAGTGKSELVQKLIEESEGKLVPPKFLDRVKDPINFEQLEGRDEFLKLDSKGRFGLTREGLLNAARKPTDPNEPLDQVVVVDADVELSKKLTSVGGVRLVGVWVGLDALDKFEEGLKGQIESGKIPIPDGETTESVRRSKIREIVKDIEYGVVSGIFEFTILNDDPEESLTQLKSAADYCFK